MPTYEYRCPDGHDFERFYRKISDAQANVNCPVCGKPAERRVSAGAGLLFKGSGFYLTDYGKNAHRAGAPEKKDTGSESKPAAEAKTDATPAKTEAKSTEAKPAAPTPASKKSDA